MAHRESDTISVDSSAETTDNDTEPLIGSRVSLNSDSLTGSIETRPRANTKLHRTIDIPNAVSISIGIMLGSGIFVSPGK